MPKARDKAPEVEFDEITAMTQSERKEVVDRYNRENPEFVHFWRPKVSSSGTKKGSIPAEVVREGEETVENRMSVLFRMRKEHSQKKRKIESERSLRMVKSVRNDDGVQAFDDPLVKYRKPKIRPKEDDNA